MNLHEYAVRSTEYLEHISWEGKPLAYIIRAAMSPEKTTFLTPSEFKQQVGFVVYSAGGEIQRHVHRPLERNLVGTSEVLIVRRGRCEIDIYNNERELVATRELWQGDIMNGYQSSKPNLDSASLVRQQFPDRSVFKTP